MTTYLIVWVVMSMTCPSSYDTPGIVLTPGLGASDLVYRGDTCSRCQCTSRLEWSFQPDDEEACRKAEEHPGALVFLMDTMRDPILGRCEVSVSKTYRFTTEPKEPKE